MGLDSLLLLLALLVLAALFVAQPLLAGEREEEIVVGEAAHWTAERERILDALAELDSDWQLGKVPKEIYKPQRDRLMRKGAQALKELDKLNEGQPAKSSALTDKQLEKIIAARKTARGKRRK
ncbi:MAG: hypothetical protein ACRDFQ_09335 [Anaerolineales bacterium]